MLPVTGPPTFAGTRDDKPCTNPPNSLSVMPMMRASHSFDAPLENAERDGGAITSFKGPATALTWPWYWATDHRSAGGQGDRSSQQFSASPITPCKNQAVMGPMLVVLRDR